MQEPNPLMIDYVNRMSKTNVHTTLLTLLVHKGVLNKREALAVLTGAADLTRNSYDNSPFKAQGSEEDRKQLRVAFDEAAAHLEHDAIQLNQLLDDLEK